MFPAQRGVLQDSLLVTSTAEEVAAWLSTHRFPNFVHIFQDFAGLWLIADSLGIATVNISPCVRALSCMHLLTFCLYYFCSDCYFAWSCLDADICWHRLWPTTIVISVDIGSDLLRLWYLLTKTLTYCDCDICWHRLWPTAIVSGWLDPDLWDSWRNSTLQCTQGQVLIAFHCAVWVLIFF